MLRKRSLLKTKRILCVMGCITCMMFSTVSFAKSYVGNVPSLSYTKSGIKVTGNASYLKKKVMISELKNLTNDIVGKNGWEMTRQIYERTKITSTEREMKDFYNKYVKSLRLKINEDGVFEIVVNEY